MKAIRDNEKEITEDINLTENSSVEDDHKINNEEAITGLCKVICLLMQNYIWVYAKLYMG